MPPIAGCSSSGQRLDALGHEQGAATHRAAARAASVPACPPPTTMTSNVSEKRMSRSREGRIVRGCPAVRIARPAVPECTEPQLHEAACLALVTVLPIAVAQQLDDVPHRSGDRDSTAAARESTREGRAPVGEKVVADPRSRMRLRRWSHAPAVQAHIPGVLDNINVVDPVPKRPRALRAAGPACAPPCAPRDQARCAVFQRPVPSPRA